MEKSYSASYAAAGVDITAGYKAVELMKQHVARTMTAGCIGGLGGFGGGGQALHQAAAGPSCSQGALQGIRAW